MFHYKRTNTMNCFTRQLFLVLVALLATKCILAQELPNAGADAVDEVKFTTYNPLEAEVANDEGMLGETSADGPSPVAPEEETANAEPTVAPGEEAPAASQPEESAPVTPEESAPVAPEESAPVAPEESAPVAPEESAPVAPEESAPVAPEETAPVAPEESAPVAPEETAPVAPEESAPVAPEESAPVAPEESAPVAPEESAPVAPEETAPTAPEESAPAAPEESAPVAPEETAPVAPEESAPVAPVPQPCTVPGNSANTEDCRSFWRCAVTIDGRLEQVVVACPANTAFSSVLNKCVRDIAGCSDDGIVCTGAAKYPDPSSNSSYYWCVPSLSGIVHKYHVQCRQGDIFHPLLEKCFIDIDNMLTLPPFYGMGPNDEDIVKVELKQFKQHDKMVLKEQKRKAKMEQKLQKELAKKAMKEAREEAKAKGSLLYAEDDDEFDDDD